MLAVLALVSLLAVGAAARRTGSEGRALPAVVDVTPGAVQRLVVEAGGRQAQLTRAGRGWSADHGTPPQSAPLLFSAEDDLFPMLAYRVLETDAADPQYGLADPQVVLRLEDNAGRRQGIRFGAASFSGAGFYAGQDGDPRGVYLVPRSTVDLLRSLTTGERRAADDRLQEKAERFQAERDDAERTKDVPVYLRQVLDRGDQIPPPGP
jgi:hypothetical protein